MREVLDRLEAKLRRLRGLDPNLEVFGAGAHRYALNPPLDEATLAALEAKIGITLPEEHRAFVLGLGDGGAGPDYGLAPMARVLGEPWVSPAQVTAPFPFEESTDPYEDDENDEDEDEPWRTGYLPLGDKGCGYENLLVVTGPRRGSVWFDFTAADGGVRDSEQSFLQWYEGWLDRGIEAREQVKRERDEAFRPWRAALHASSRDVEANYQLGRLYWQLDQDAKLARQHLESAVRFDPGHPPATALLCQLLRLAGALDPIVALADAALAREAEAEPVKAWLLAWRGIALEQRGEDEAAVADLEAALKLDKTTGWRAHGVRLPAAYAQRRLGNLDRARGLLRSAPATPLVYYWLGRVELERGEATAAVEALEKAARATPKPGIGVGPVPEDVREWLERARAAAT